MKILNLTPHDLVIIDKNDNPVSIARTQIEQGRCLLLRATTRNEVVGKLGDFDVVKTTFGVAELVTVDATGKDPQPFEQTLPNWTSLNAVIVSQIALSACGGDLQGVKCFSPGALIRDDKGQPIGAKGLTAL
jgi:hypothetical protein